MAAELRANAIIGTEIYDRLGEKLGPVEDFVLGGESACILCLILNFGGHVVGINQRYYKLPWQALTFDEAGGRYVFAGERDMLGSTQACVLSSGGVWVAEGA